MNIRYALLTAFMALIVSMGLTGCWVRQASLIPDSERSFPLLEGVYVQETVLGRSNQKFQIALDAENKVYEVTEIIDKQSNSKNESKPTPIKFRQVANTLFFYGEAKRDGFMTQYTVVELIRVENRRIVRYDGDSFGKFVMLYLLQRLDSSVGADDFRSRFAKKHDSDKPTTYFETASQEFDWLIISRAVSTFADQIEIADVLVRESP